MRTIGFIGAYDKIDLIIYVARILTEMHKKVLVVDTTILQKAKYIVPTISPSKTYVTNFEGIDIAVGFQNYESIKQYLGLPVNSVFEYEYIFLDIDTAKAVNEFEIKSVTKNYFVTSFDSYSLKRGLEILSGISEPVNLTKILFSKNFLDEEDDYLNYLSLGYKIIWEGTKIYFPFEQGDQSVIIENQRIAKIKLKNLSELYKKSLLYISENVIDSKEKVYLKKAFKQLEKGV